MPRVFFVNEDRSIDLPPGVTILEAARKAKAIIEAPCDGTGKCGKCHVILRGSGEVLACRTVVSHDMTIEIPDYEKENAELDILTEGAVFDYPLKPFIHAKTQDDCVEIYGGDELLGIERGITEQELYGIALDIGTTTLAASLYDLRTGKHLDTETDLNPQTAYGQDVLSRIRFASKKEPLKSGSPSEESSPPKPNPRDENFKPDLADNPGLETLFSVFMESLNGMIEIMTARKGIDRKRIYEIVFSGNTTMLHIATGTNPYSLGQYPYDPVIRGGVCVNAGALGAAISPFGIIYLPPVISAFIGSDITSGILASKLAESKDTVLFIDIGTNGEMALAKDGHIAAASTAAGPAFEGMNISCGMRASRGAIESFSVELEGNFSFKTIGGAEAEGICGSGLIDIAGELVKAGVVGPNGRFPPPSAEGQGLLRNNVREREGKRAFFITDNIYLSQNDIRQIQLAKSAIRTGIETLLTHLNIKPEDITRVDIAGSFGFHLNERSLLNVGLLPEAFRGKTRFTGNTSLIGAAAFLLNFDFRDKAWDLVSRIKTVELAKEENFDRIFIRNMGFEQ